MSKVLERHAPKSAVLEFLADGLVCFLALSAAATVLPAGESLPRGLLVAISRWVLPAVGFCGFTALVFSVFEPERLGAIRIGSKTLLAHALLAVAVGFYLACLVLEAQGRGRFAFQLLVSAAPLMFIGVAMVRGFAFLARSAAPGSRRVLIVGTGAEAQAVARELASGPSARHAVVGFYPAGPGASGDSAPGRVTFSSELTIDQVVRQHRIDEVIVAVLEQRGGAVPMGQLLACRIRGIPVRDQTAFFEHARGEVPTESLKLSWLVYGHGFVQGRVRTVTKRVFDVAASALLLAMAWPLMLLTALAIRLESRGPVIYCQERVGLGGQPFMCPKFRSMRIDAEGDGVARWASQNDSRVTRVGHLIRKFRIDELPQLLSVLGGTMSLVGPRPERPSFVSHLREQIPHYDIRHSVKPGVTGWAQVRYSYGASVEDARRKHRFDLYYVKNNSLRLDVLVLLKTVRVVLIREGAR